MKLLLSLAVLPTLITAMQAPLVRTTYEIILPNLIMLESFESSDIGTQRDYLNTIPTAHLAYCLDQIVELIMDKTRFSQYYTQNGFKTLFDENRLFTILLVLREKIIKYNTEKARNNAPAIHNSVRSYEHNPLAKMNEDNELAQALELSRLEHEKEQKIRTQYAEQKAAELKAYEAHFCELLQLYNL